MKVCKVCGQEKPLSEFYKRKDTKDGHRNKCKSCEKEKSKHYYLDNKEKIREKKKDYHQEKKEKRKQYNLDNSEKINEWRRGYRKNRRKNDTLFRLSCNVRGMVHRAIKTKRTEEIIGCSFQELKLHLEQQFTEGMSWENYGDWHIDHIYPLSWFVITDPEEVAKANHYTNLQPLWAEENLSKGNRFAS